MRDEELKRMAQASRTEVPPLVRVRVEETLAGLPMQSMQKRGMGKIRTLAIALAALLIVYSSGFMSPTMAGILKKVPLIGETFQHTGDSGLRNAQERGFSTPVNQQATDQGITLAITDVIYDGTRLSVGLAGLYPDGADRAEAAKGITDMDITMPNHIGHYTMPASSQFKKGSAFHWYPLGDHEYAGVYNYDPVKMDLPDQFDVTIQVNQVGSTSGKWLFHFPVSIDKAKAASRDIAVNQTKDSQGRKVTVEAIRFTPTNTTVQMRLDSPSFNEDYLSKHNLFTSITVTDEKGTPLPHLADKQGVPNYGGLISDPNKHYIDVNIQYAPLQTIPKKLAIHIGDDISLDFDVPVQ